MLRDKFSVSTLYYFVGILNDMCFCFWIVITSSSYIQERVTSIQ